MKILFTGGSSFTGSRFIQELAAAGHEVTAIFRKADDAYPDDVRRRRVQLATKVSRPIYGCSFGDESFLGLLAEGGWDLLCHHAADVTDYKSPAFDTVGALQNNTHNLTKVVQALAESGTGKVLLTGSVFEGGEGAGSQGLPSFSPYGLSKALTDQMFRFYCDREKVVLGKFVIPNPFGPLEEPRFTGYLFKNWFGGNTPSCSSPSYVRDNIHVSLLAKVYAKFAQDLLGATSFTRINPSGYAESQGAFSVRLSQEMEPRLKRPCPVVLARQTDFPEPRVRINTDIPDVDALKWSETQAWDELAAFYLELYGAK